VHVISPKKLRQFWSVHPDAERPLRAWLTVVQSCRYASPHEVRQDFGSVGRMRSTTGVRTTERSDTDPGRETTMAQILDFTKPHVLRTEEEYDAAIVEIERLLDLDPAPYSDDYERLEFLSVLAEAYERAHFQIDGSSPADVVEFMLEQKGMPLENIDALLGGAKSAAQFFDGARKLSREEIEALRDLLGISADLLL
jgi:HTH-type transcriptional regulator/antitoxin HigA